MTLRDLIKSSLRLLGVLQPGEEPTQQQMNDALQALNQMVDSWSNDYLNIYKVKPFYFNTVPGQQSYTLGPNGDWQIPRPMQLQKAVIYQNLTAQGTNPTPPPPPEPLLRYLQIAQTWQGGTPTWSQFDQGYVTQSVNDQAFTSTLGGVPSLFPAIVDSSPFNVSSVIGNNIFLGPVDFYQNGLPDTQSATVYATTINGDMEQLPSWTESRTVSFTEPVNVTWLLPGTDRQAWALSEFETVDSNTRRQTFIVYPSDSTPSDPAAQTWTLTFNRNTESVPTSFNFTATDGTETYAVNITPDLPGGELAITNPDYLDVASIQAWVNANSEVTDIETFLEWSAEPENIPAGGSQVIGEEQNLYVIPPETSIGFSPPVNMDLGLAWVLLEVTILSAPASNKSWVIGWWSNAGFPPFDTFDPENAFGNGLGADYLGTNLVDTSVYSFSNTPVSLPGLQIGDKVQILVGYANYYQAGDPDAYFNQMNVFVNGQHVALGQPFTVNGRFYIGHGFVQHE